MEIFTSFQELRYVLDLFLAMILGAIVGFERTHLHKIAGLRTYALVTVGACFFTIISNYVFKGPNLAAAVVTGIGFLGAGLIIHHGSKVEGITTAAALWTMASVGVGIGSGLYILSIAATILLVLIMGLFRSFGIEEKLDEFLFKKNKQS